MFNILLIEADLKVVRAVETILEPHGCTIHHAPSGLAGLQLARQIRPDLILLDTNLPDLNGKVITLNLRGMMNQQTTPIVALMAESGAKARRIAHGIGCDDFISKPIDAHDAQSFPARIAAILARAGVKDDTAPDQADQLDQLDQAQDGTPL